MPPPPAFPGSAPAYPGSQPQPGFPGGFTPSPTIPPPTPTSGGGGKKVALIVVAVLVVLAAVGAGVGYYLLSRPKPTITVTSQYTDNGTPVGADGTVLHISGQKFSGNSSITFLLDGQAAPGSSTVQSDSDGNVKTDLKVSKDWSVDKHTLTARDAKDYTTKSGVSVEIVKPGQKQTPGPNGAPTNASSAFTINVTITLSDGGTFNAKLDFTPKDDNGGTICQNQYDDGASHSFNGSVSTSSGTFNYVEVATYQCKGTYSAGHVNYQEVTTKAEFDFDNGAKCNASTPYNEEVFVGDFSDAKTVSGTWSADEIQTDCTLNNRPLNFTAQNGTWTGTI
jgi:hypothetical protein